MKDPKMFMKTIHKRSYRSTRTPVKKVERKLSPEESEELLKKARHNSDMRNDNYGRHPNR